MNLRRLSVTTGALVVLASANAAQVTAQTDADNAFAKAMQYLESGSKGPWIWPASLDAPLAARNHKVLLENDRVRVLEVTLGPHEKENVHTHPWPSVFINPVKCDGDVIIRDGQRNVLLDSRKSPYPYQVATWRSGPEPPHAFESLSDSSCTFYRVELKHLATAAAAGPWPASMDGPTADPKNHKVILENEFVRVLELSGDAHEKERVHVHPWPSVAIQDTPWFDFLNHGEGAAILFDSRTAKGIICPCVHWDDPQAPHWIENLSDKSWHGYRVELKQ